MKLQHIIVQVNNKTNTLIILHKSKDILPVQKILKHLVSIS